MEWTTALKSTDSNWFSTWLNASRRPLSLDVARTEILPTFLCYYLIAVLAQYSGTRLVRLGLWPLTMYLMLNGLRRWDFSEGPEALHATSMNQTSLIMVVVFMVNASIWTFLPRITRSDSPPKSFKTALVNAGDLMINLRGLGWDFARGVYVPPHPAGNLSRPVFLLRAAGLTLCNFILGDICVYLVQQLAPDTFGSPKGGSLFDPSLPRHWVYGRAVAAELFTLGFCYFSLLLIYHFLSILGVGLAGQKPSQWPPLLNQPAAATSLADLWAKRWHQGFRVVFLYGAGYPFGYLFGRFGLVLSVFGFSALLHHVGYVSIGRGTHYSVILSFMMTGVGLIIEWLWRKATGRKVGGFLGWLWVVTWSVVWFMPLVDAWAEVGYLGARWMDTGVRPSTWIVALLAKVRGVLM